MWCSAINCSNSRKKNPLLSFFRFPKDEDRCRQWVDLCRRRDLAEKSTNYISENCQLCANHFEDTQFMNYQKRDSLVWNAVPTLFHISSSPKRLKYLYRPPLPCKQDLLLKTGKRVSAQNQKKLLAEDLYVASSTALESEHLNSSDSELSVSTEAKHMAPYDTVVKVSVAESPGNVPTRMPFKETVTSLQTTIPAESLIMRTTSAKVPLVKADEMVNFCAGLNCRNTRQKCPEMAFLRFPKDQARSNAWVQQTRKPDLKGKSADYLHRTAVLCETHFDDDQWMNKDDKSLGLIPKAIPTVFDVPFPPVQMTVKRKWSSRRLADDRIEIGDMEHDQCYACSDDRMEAVDPDKKAKCCVLNCPNESSPYARLYTFPADRNRYRQWVTYCERESGWSPGIHSRLCELHFDDNQFVKGLGEGDDWRPLKPEAIPSRHFLSMPLRSRQKLRSLLGQAASQDETVQSVTYSSDDDPSGTDSPQENRKMPRKGAANTSVKDSTIAQKPNGEDSTEHEQLQVQGCSANDEEYRLEISDEYESDSTVAPPKPNRLHLKDSVRKTRGRPRIHPPKDPSIRRPRGRPRVIPLIGEYLMMKTECARKEAVINKLSRYLEDLGHSVDEILKQADNNSQNNDNSSCN